MKIFNETSVGIVDVGVDTPSPNKGPKNKKKLALGLAPKSNGNGQDKDKKEGKEVTFDVAADQCLVDMTFNLADGQQISQANVDICMLDGFVVEEPPPGRGQIPEPAQ